MSRLLSRAIALACAASAVSFLHADTAMLCVNPSGPNFFVTTPANDGKALTVGPMAWGPNWGWTGINGKFEPSGAGVEAQLSGNLGNAAGVTISGSISVQPESKRRFKVSGSFGVSADTDLTTAVLYFDAGEAWRGAGRITFVDGDGNETVESSPPGNGGIHNIANVKAARIRDAAGAEIILTYDIPLDLRNHGAIRWPFANESMKADAPRNWSFTIEFPFDVDVHPTPETYPMPKDIDRWFAWTAAADTGPSVIGAEHLLDAPAGKHGRVKSEGGKIFRNGKPIKFWGLNNCYSSCFPAKELAEQRAAFYAKNGINSVRFHKYASGHGWGGILANNSALEFAEGPANAMDYYVKCLKDRGIYLKLSAQFGNMPVGPDDRARIANMDELARADGSGWSAANQASVWLHKDVQDLVIGQVVNVLNRVNTATEIRYADDPAIFTVEIINENCAFFYNVWGQASGNPLLKRMAGEQFRDWLHAKYGTEEKLLAAWGDVNYNGVPDQGTTDESWDGVIYPAGNPWYWDNLGPDGNSFFWDKPHPSGEHDGRWPRLTDAALFLYDLQNKFFDRFVAAVRATGYEGEIIAGNWHAGSGLSHYLNLLSDHRIGMVDRHNYHGEYWSMFSRPGSSLLSTGLNTQMSDRPYMMSEWIHEAKGFPHFNIDPTAPRAFDIISEGPVLFAAYGMCLNGWDGAFIFQNQDAGRFSGAIHSTWDPFLPSIIGLYPAVARMVLRGDVSESEQLFARNISMKSLEKGVIGFNDILASAGHDNRDVSSAHIPEQVIAVGRAVVTLNDEPTPTDSVDPSQFMVDGRYVSSTGELTWRPGENIRDGDITINAPRSQGIAGFTRGRKAELADVDIVTTTPYAVIYVTSLDDAQPVATAKNVLITALARIRNTDQRMAGDSSMDWGRGPILMEPVVAEITVKRPGAFTVHILDQDGRRTGDTLPVEGRVIKLDTAENKTIYYEIEF